MNLAKQYYFIKIVQIIAISIAMISLFSCKSTQIITPQPTQTDTSVIIENRELIDTIIPLHYTQFKPLYQYDYDWISYRGKANYTFKGKDGELNLFFVNKIDSIIYININLSGIEVVRMVLLPNELIYVNKLNKTYYKGDYRFFNKIAGISINFNMFQATMNGKDFPNFNTDFTITENDNQYILLHQNRTDLQGTFNLIQKITLNQSAQMVQNSITIKSILRKIMINYSDYLPIEDKSYFHNMTIESSEFSILLNLKNIKFNTPGPTSITIPESFSVIEFN
ncbi:MAG TPA: DUF4292 domain-containing protein [Bacteroidales bacterium]|nr:DUF4292 domain-containing protein [Bacteroidales bacterium]HPS72425.1 DUF4292 domain-containing protein [Bacteroidales bacterium]